MSWTVIFQNEIGSIEINEESKEFVIVNESGNEVGGGDFTEIETDKETIIKQLSFMGMDESEVKEACNALYSCVNHPETDNAMDAYFLRFTKDADRDMQNGRSLWFVYDDEEVERMKAGGKELIFVEDAGESGEWATFHNGLCGHGLEAETLEEAIEEAKTRVGNFGNIRTDSWAIFEGDYVDDDIMEGDAFKPRKVVYVSKSTSSFDCSL
jgi:hypothetical protein